MADYSEGKVYMLYVEGLEEFCYIGSTVQTLAQRLTKHKYQKKSDADYQFASAPLFEDGNDVKIKLLEEVSCESKAELLMKEREWLDKFPNAINKNPPICLDDEERRLRGNAISLNCYYNNREYRIAKHKEWVLAHKEEESEKQKQRRLDNLEEHRKRDRDRRNANKDEINAKKKEKVECPECKKIMNKNSLWEHKKKIHPPN